MRGNFLDLLDPFTSTVLDDTETTNTSQAAETSVDSTLTGNDQTD